MSGRAVSPPREDPPQQDEQLTLGGQITFCTRDQLCQAAANQHEPDCPVEQRLKDEFGF